MELDITQICRLCVKNLPADSYNIFIKYKDERKSKQNSILYKDLIVGCTKLKPIESDGLPSNICHKCAKLLKITFNFISCCEKNEKTLKEYLVSQNGELPESNAEIGNKDFENITENIKNELSEVPLKLEPVTEDVENEEQSSIKGHSYDDETWDADEDLVLSELQTKHTVVKQDIKSEDGTEAPKKKKRGRPKKEAPRASKLPHQCETCGKVISTRSNLTVHMLSHTDVRPHRCNLCPATFRSYSGLFQHRKVHTKETPYHCEYCPKQFGRRTGLVNHVKIHTGDKGYTCEICLKSFTQSAQLYVHLKRHRGDKPFLCQVCGKGFSIQSDLKVHQRVHSGEKPYTCPICRKNFSTTGNLAIHTRFHKQEIRYHCKFCSRGFVTSSSYKVHLKRHKGQRDYECDCGKTFYTSSALKQHKVVHTGEKKHKCRVCDKSFSQTSHMNRHMRKDHPKDVKPKVVMQKVQNGVTVTSEASELAQSAKVITYKIDNDESV